MLQMLNGLCPSYDTVLKALYTNIDEKKEEGDINVFIPVRGRFDFFEICIRYLRDSANKIGLKLNIVIIENDINHNLAKRAIELDLSYIFIPVAASFSSGSFAKSLCYNIGFLKTKRVKWNLFFGIDYLVEENFFERVMYHLSYIPNWLQPYKAHIIQSLGPIETKKILESKKVKLLELEGETFPILKPAGPVIVRDTDFIEIGGYDPEFFINSMYADIFFWTKLELQYKEIQGNILSNIMDNASFANDPPINVYHLYHQPVVENSAESMHSLLRLYYQSENRKRQHVIGLKKLIFDRAINFF